MERTEEGGELRLWEVERADGKVRGIYDGIETLKEIEKDNTLVYTTFALRIS